MSHSSSRVSPLAPRSPFYQGPFGRLFGDLPAWAPDVPPSRLEAHFQTFARERMVEAPGVSPTEIANDPALRNRLDNDFGSSLPAGYTYFGQFVDHDVTFDPTPLSMARRDPSRLLNFRTPRLDLDNVYGRGPDDQPYLYQAGDRALFAVESIVETPFFDLPRARNANGQARTALIGDMRNDENVIVSQLQLAFLLAHNELVGRARDQGLGGDAFEAAQRTLRWLYQWVVWNDFVGRIAHRPTFETALVLDTTHAGFKRWEPGYTELYDWKHQPFMPVEFSAAAYRFGHSLVRNDYLTNSGPQAGERLPIFDVGAENPDDLRGFRPVRERTVIQWDLFLPLTSSQDGFPQRARKIDTKLSNALAALIENPAEPDSIENVLAARNLVRGVRMELPSGPDVARALGLEPVALDDNEPRALWYYLLKEAEVNQGGERLGQAGSAIVCSTIAGLLMGDETSFFNQAPDWRPDDDPLLQDADKVDDANWALSSIIRLSGLPTASRDFEGR